ncbi:MAG: DNA/RNA nuclease SfsA [Candidatus Aminicenantes bacterium]|jgi:sugar fermentation stimulation protein A
MEPFKLYPGFEEAFFVERENRFVMQLKKKNKQLIKAYVANPGRMEEFLVAGHPFFITNGNEGKYYHRIVSTFYQDSYVLLDTIKINSLVELLLKNNRIKAFSNPISIRREVTVNRSKFDFLVKREGENRKPTLLEIKSCSLCHNGVAMFPDAPTKRGKRHLEDLDFLAAGDYEAYTLYWINHKKAKVFMPNGHTDKDYCETFCSTRNVNFLAYCVNMTDPVTLDLSFLKNVPIDFEASRFLCAEKGSYLLIFHNNQPFTKIIGSLGEREFRQGYYVYVGSAMQALDKRIKRHLRKSKTRRWHLDHISPGTMKIEKVYPIRRQDRIEEALARGVLEICDDYVKGFGASDSGLPSHFFYFSGRPFRRRDFLDLLLNFRMGISEPHL